MGEQGERPRVISRTLRRAFGPRFSRWQAVELAKVIALIVAGTSAALFSVGAIHAVLKLFADGASPMASAELAAGLVFGAMMACSAYAYRVLYFEGREMKERPVIETTVPKKRGTVWQRLYPELDMVTANACAPRDAARRNEEAAARYANEFFYNALVNPRTVFSRISEHVQPGVKMLDCRTEYEVRPHPDRNLRVYGINDYAVRNREGVSCYLPVPVALLYRGNMAVRQDVTNAGDIRFPHVQQREVIGHIIGMIERYEFSDGLRLEDDPDWRERLRPKVERYLGSMEGNESLDVPVELHSRMASAAQSEDDMKFAERICYMLSGLKDVMPVCVSIHAVAVPQEPRDPRSTIVPNGPEDFPGRIFNLRYEQKIATSPKRWDMIPEGAGNPFVRLFNRIAGFFGRDGNTVYYNLASAGRTPSYHLYLEGPEGTYYARGSLLRADTRDKRDITAAHVEMQKRYGQRQAHIYIRDGHRMSNVVFMFRYMKTPIDTSHIMSAASFLGVAVLTVAALTSIGALNEVAGMGGASGLSVPAMVLAVATAAGPWIYNRLSDGRSESLGIEVAAILLTFCCASGIVLFFFVAGTHPGLDAAVWMWSVLLSVMTADMLCVAFAALLHSRMYRTLADRPEDNDSDGGFIVPTKRSLQYSEDGDIRLDTPPGRFASNPYRFWTEGLRCCRSKEWELKFEKEM